jgi:hypothetical protein
MSDKQTAQGFKKAELQKFLELLNRLQNERDKRAGLIGLPSESIYRVKSWVSELLDEALRERTEAAR